MKAIAVILILILISLIIWATIIAVDRGLQGISKSWLRRKKNSLGWKMYEAPLNGKLTVYLISPDYDPINVAVGSVDFSAEDFDMQIELLRAEGRQKLVALNSERKLPSSF